MKAYLVKSPITGKVMIGLVVNDQELILTKVEAQRLQMLVDAVVAAAGNVGGQKWGKSDDQRLQAGEIVFTQ